MSMNLTLRVDELGVPEVIFREPHVRAAGLDNIECP